MEVSAGPGLAGTHLEEGWRMSGSCLVIMNTNIVDNVDSSLYVFKGTVVCILHDSLHCLLSLVIRQRPVHYPKSSTVSFILLSTVTKTINVSNTIMPLFVAKALY